MALPPDLVVARDGDLAADVLAAARLMVVEAFDDDFTADDWEHTMGGWRVVALVAGAPIAHAAVVPRVVHVGERRFHAGYVEGVATVADRRRCGVGSSVMGAIGEIVRERFEVGALSTDAHGFYARLGWERWGGPTYVRRGDRLERTVDEDDGIMVLRVGPSASIDLGAAISCEQRSGDDW